MKTGRLLKRHFSEISWSVAEVNKKNGSAKLFGFTGQPIPIERARELGQRIHDVLIENGLGKLEVFPFSCVQVGLPMRIDKTTIISSGVLSKCQRKKKIDDKMVQFETYSTLAFLDAIRSASRYDEDTLHRVLKFACANLPDQPIVATIPPTPKIDKLEVKSEVNLPQPNASSTNNEPNSLTRQLAALLEVARRLRRVPSEKEALAFIRQNQLYSGDWADNESRRRSRVCWIVKHIAKTFDPARCGSPKYKIEFGKYDGWARAHVGTLRERVRRYVDEYGKIHEVRGRTMVDWRFVSVMLSIVEFCFKNPNSDQSLSEKGARKIWETSLQSKIIDVKWNGRKWAIARDWLNNIGIINVFDREWHFKNGNGQAMKWRPTEKFHNLHVWYRVKRKSCINDCVLVETYIQRRHDTPTLNYYRNTGTLLRTFGSVKWRSRAPPWRE